MILFEQGHIEHHFTKPYNTNMVHVAYIGDCMNNAVVTDTQITFIEDRMILKRNTILDDNTDKWYMELETSNMESYNHKRINRYIRRSITYDFIFRTFTTAMVDYNVIIFSMYLTL